MKKKGECLCWCPFHNQLIGWVDFERRVSIIRMRKSSRGIPIRLEEMKPVKGYVPSDVIKTCRSFQGGYGSISEMSNAIKRSKSWLEKLHKKEVPDSRWDGRRIVFY